MDGISHVPRTVDEIFNDFRGRRAGLIKALTMEVGKLYQQCDPGKVNLCLYGLPNETWEVNLPAEMVPPDLPKPTLGINFAKDGMPEEDWLSLVALQSDSWLHSVAFYFGGGVGFGKSERKRLFQMINDLPTVFEVVTGTVKQSKDQFAAQNNSNKSKSGGNMGSTLSGACSYHDGRDEFLICCGTCKRWFHAKCIEVTPTQDEHIKQCKFSRSIKKARWDCSDYLRLIFCVLFILISVFQCGMSYGKKQ